MKGVKINNYIDNRIVLSGRKLKNQLQTVIQSHQPRPVVIRHVNYYQQEQEHHFSQQKQHLKAIQTKLAKKKKKKSKVLTNNIGEVNHQLIKKEQKKSAKRQENKKVSAKKRSAQSSPSKNSQSHFNQTEKKIKGLGKRSKSAIIKGNKSPSNFIIELQRKRVDSINNNKKIQTNNPQKKLAKKQKKPGNRVSTKQLRKNPSSTLNHEQRRKFSQIGFKSSRVNLKSSLLTKPVSARQKKKQQKIGSSKKNFNSSQKKKKRQSINLLQIFKFENSSDQKIKDAMTKLQQALNNGGSRSKLPQIIEQIVGKLNEQKKKDLMYDQQSQGYEEYHVNSQSDKSDKQLQLKKQLQYQMKLKIPHKSEQHKDEEQEQQDIERTRKNKFSNIIISNQIKQSINANIKDQQFQQIFQTPIKKQNKESGEKNNQETNTNQQESVQDSQKQKIIEKRQNYMKDPDIARQILKRQNGIYQNQDNYANVMIGRKAIVDPYVELQVYASNGSVKSYQSNGNSDSKFQEINQLKQFAQQCNIKMTKIQANIKKKKSQDQICVNTQLNPKIQMNKSQLVKQKSPRNLQLKNYAFEKYPNPQSLKSPKFNSQQILQLIKLKQKIQTDRHEKLSELVNVMYDKNIVSPKTYSLHVQTLREQQAQNNQVLGNYKKHAEQLAQLLSQIRKQKQEITNIDEMIRSQKWNQAINIIQVKENAEKKPEIQAQVQQQQIGVQEQKQSFGFKLKPVKLQDQVNRQEKEKVNQIDEVIYYSGEQSNLSQLNQKLIQIQNDEGQDPNKKQQNVKLIKIDESDQIIDQPAQAPKKQRGFDSNLFFIKQYCIALCEYVRDNYKQNFRSRIGKPMAYNLIKLLETFRTNRDNSPAVSLNSLCEDLKYHDCQYHQNIQPIDQDIFEQFNKSYPTLKYYGKEETQDAKLEGIFLKSIYDALNQSISIQKPGGIVGKALPWAHSSKHLKNLKNEFKRENQYNLRNQDSQDLIFGIAIARIIQWGSCLCGFIPDTVQLQNTQIDQQYINHIRETRTALLLEKMLIDEQALMYRLDLEQTQIKLCVSKMLQDEMVNQIVQQMKKINHRSALREIDY